MKEITVEVTADDIEFGEAESCRFCPVARALIRKVHPNHAPAVSGDIAFYDFRKSGVRCGDVLMPQCVTSFVRAFDYGEKDGVAPFTFALTVPDWVELLPTQ